MWQLFSSPLLLGFWVTRVSPSFVGSYILRFSSLLQFDHFHLSCLSDYWFFSLAVLDLSLNSSTEFAIWVIKFFYLIIPIGVFAKFGSYLALTVIEYCQLNTVKIHIVWVYYFCGFILNGCFVDVIYVNLCSQIRFSYIFFR